MNPDAMFDPLSLKVADVAKILAASGNGPVSEEMVRADIKAGAPVGTDGRMNLLQYAAWLVKEMGRGGD